MRIVCTLQSLHYNIGHTHSGVTKISGAQQQKQKVRILLRPSCSEVLGLVGSLVIYLTQIFQIVRQ